MGRVLFAALAMTLASCAAAPDPSSGPATLSGDQAPRVDYQPPQNAPLGAVSFDLDSAADDAVDRIVSALAGPRFGITHIDRAKGIVTATYRTDPLAYLDCGQLGLQPASFDATGTRLPAAQGKMNYQVPLGERRYGLVDRSLQLDGRMIVEVTPINASSARVTVVGDYVVTRTLRVAVRDGGEVAERREWMDFGSAQAGRFGEGQLTCQSNGALESYLQASLQGSSPVTDLPVANADTGTAGPSPITATPLEPIDSPALLQESLESEAVPTATAALGAAGSDLEQLRPRLDELACAPLTLSSNGEDRTMISGFVASEDDLQALRSLANSAADAGDLRISVSVASAPFCRILAVTLPLKDANDRSQAGALVALPGDALYEGDDMIIDATTPQFTSYVYMFYAQQDGSLVHLFPNPDRPNNVMAANRAMRIGDADDARQYLVVPPYGVDMVTIVASTEPLFSLLRPDVEQAADFASDLNSAVEEAKRLGADVVADIIFVETRPRKLSATGEPN